MKRDFAVAITLVCAVASVAATALAEPETRRLQHGGQSRVFIIANAEAARSERRPVVIALHGRRAANEPLRSSPALDALASKEGFVAVYPGGVDGAWYYPQQSASQSEMAGGKPVDDIGFIGAVIDRLIGERIAEPGNIYVSGSSMGGFMTWALMCGLSQRFAAAAPMLAGMTERQLAECKPERAVPAIVIAGTEDHWVPYDGWIASDYRIASIPETLEFWRRLHGCTGQQAMRPPYTLEPREPTRTSLIEWTGCRIEGALRLFRIDGGGHTLPSRQPIGKAQRERFGYRSNEIETSEELWSFFKRFSR